MPKWSTSVAVVALVALLLPSCTPVTPTPADKQDTIPTSPAIASYDTVPVYTYRVVNSYPHDSTAFTQGLAFVDGTLYEGTGIRGRSELRSVELRTGHVLQQRELPPQLFGEGVTVFQDRVIQLTWQSGLGFVYDISTFELLREFHYLGEGWGITHDGERMIMSNGTSVLHLLDPETYEEIGIIEVKDDKGPVAGLNELEYVDGEILANVWSTDLIARVSPDTGQVVGWVDLSGLLDKKDQRESGGVLNGIAHDAQGTKLFVTGKMWPKLFEIEILLPRGE